MKILVPLFVLTTLTACVISPTKVADKTRKTDSVDRCPKPVKIKNVRISRPLELEGFGERHTQIQQVIASRTYALTQCRKFYGGLKTPIVFDVDQNGNFSVKPDSKKSPAAECIERIFTYINAGAFHCELGFSYDWDGKFPMINHLTTFPPTQSGAQVKDY